MFIYVQRLSNTGCAYRNIQDNVKTVQIAEKSRHWYDMEIYYTFCTQKKEMNEVLFD
jgi:hypothetical protein